MLLMKDNLRGLYLGGSAVAVSSQNRHRYINLVAKYYLHDRLRVQAAHFFRGLHEVISTTVLKPFCAPELQVLISGANTGVSVSDLRANTRYNGYNSFDVSISRFWSIMEKFTEQERGQLLKFVTSCERPPSLGFAALTPPFTIQRVDCSDDSRLPTASTCFNILKLPTYSNENTMREKLLMSIKSGAGFDLS
jgi:ubiquitin-protein ligase E3 C